VVAFVVRLTKTFNGPDGFVPRDAVVLVMIESRDRRAAFVEGGYDLSIADLTYDPHNRALRAEVAKGVWDYEALAMHMAQTMKVVIVLDLSDDGGLCEFEKAKVLGCAREVFVQALDPTRIF
jgi:hypothetical protein